MILWFVFTENIFYIYQIVQISYMLNIKVIVKYLYKLLRINLHNFQINLIYCVTVYLDIFFQHFSFCFVQHS